MRPTAVGRVLSVGLLAAGLSALAGCGGQPDHAPPTTAAVVTPKSTAAPSPTPSPTPTGPHRAPDDPTWTPEQLAAVRAVDAYYEVFAQVYADPAAANLGDWNTVTTDPQRAKEVQRTLDSMALGYTQSGGPVIAVGRTVGALRILDGHSEVTLTQCQADDPELQPYEHGTPIPVVGLPRNVYEYTVQWVEAAQGWRVSDVVKVSDGC